MSVKFEMQSEDSAEDHDNIDSLYSEHGCIPYPVGISSFVSRQDADESADDYSNEMLKAKSSIA